MGLSQRQSVLIMYLASATLGLCAIVLADRGALSAIILLLAVSVFVLGGAKYMNDHGIMDDNVVEGNKEPGKATSGAIRKKSSLKEKLSDGIIK